jgi:hypothetical protein
VHQMEQAVRSIHSSGVNVTSFGIGNAYAEQMMRAIARAGHGGASGLCFVCIPR